MADHCRLSFQHNPANKPESKCAQALSIATYQLTEADHLIEIRLVGGLGCVEYYGTPTGKKNVSGLGSVTSLGSPYERQE